MIAKDLQPFSIVENEGFTHLVKTLAPLYEMPSRATVTRRIEDRFGVIKGDFIKKIEQASSYCITCDNWTDCTSQGYMGITVHYLENFKIESAVLGCIPLHERHTARYLAEILGTVLGDFHIDLNKVTAIISDGDAAIKNACVSLVGPGRHLVCFAHTLAHIIPDSLEEVEDF